VYNQEVNLGIYYSRDIPREMTVPVLVTPSNGQFVAVVVGTPEIRGAGPSRAEAIAALRKDLVQRTQQGELTWIDIEPSGVSGLAGSFADDPTLREICAEIYRERDAELQR
jgi:hypothetical protein